MGDEYVFGICTKHLESVYNVNVVNVVILLGFVFEHG
jgi:hypothetical protein